MLSTPRFTLQNIIQLLHHMDHPMILCDSSLRTVYSNAAFNRHYGEAYASLDVLATAASRSRIQQARDAGQTIDVSCNGRPHETCKLHVCWLKTADADAAYMVGEIIARQADEAEDAMQNLAVISACVEQISNTLQQLLTELSSFSLLVPEQPGSREQLYLANMKKDTLRITRNAHLLRDAARIMQNAYPLNIAVHDIGQALHMITKEARQYAAKKHVSIVLDVPDEPVLVPCDLIQFSRAILNILSNILYFTGENGELKIGLHKSGQTVSIGISDNGDGIPDYYLERILTNDILYADDRPILGLYVAQNVVRKHGGNMFVTQVKPHGTRIIIDLPADDLYGRGFKQAAAIPLQEILRLLAQIEMSIL